MDKSEDAMPKDKILQFPFIVELDSFCQDELYSAAKISNFPHSGFEGIVDFKIDKSLFNESAGSKRQTYSSYGVLRKQEESSFNSEGSKGHSKGTTRKDSKRKMFTWQNKEFSKEFLDIIHRSISEMDRKCHHHYYANSLSSYTSEKKYAPSLSLIKEKEICHDGKGKPCEAWRQYSELKGLNFTCEKLANGANESQEVERIVYNVSSVEHREIKRHKISTGIVNLETTNEVDFYSEGIGKPKEDIHGVTGNYVLQPASRVEGSLSNQTGGLCVELNCNTATTRDKVYLKNGLRQKQISSRKGIDDMSSCRTLQGDTSKDFAIKNNQIQSRHHRSRMKLSVSVNMTSISGAKKKGSLKGSKSSKKHQTNSREISSSVQEISGEKEHSRKMKKKKSILENLKCKRGMRIYKNTSKCYRKRFHHHINCNSHALQSLRRCKKRRIWDGRSRKKIIWRGNKKSICSNISSKDSHSKIDLNDKAYSDKQKEATYSKENTSLEFAMCKKQQKFELDTDMQSIFPSVLNQMLNPNKSFNINLESQFFCDAIRSRNIRLAVCQWCDEDFDMAKVRLPGSLSRWTCPNCRIIYETDPML